VSARRPPVLLFAALAAFAPGCVTLATLRPLPRACPGALPPVEALGVDFTLRAHYRVQSRGKDLALSLAVEKRGARLVLVGIDPLGTSVFALVQEGAALSRERHLRLLFPFAPENVLRDVVRVRFPDLTAGDDAIVSSSASTTTIARPSCDWTATLSL
jgi:Protein of unknown function (DUF3261)